MIIDAFCKDKQFVWFTGLFMIDNKWYGNNY